MNLRLRKLKPKNDAPYLRWRCNPKLEDDRGLVREEISAGFYGSEVQWR